MGTTYRVKVVARELPAERRQQLAAAIEQWLDAVDASMSTYRPDSELSRFNQHVAGTPFAVSTAMAEVFAAALELGQATGGALDITLGPLVDAWGFGPGGRGAVPDPQQLAELRSRIGLGLLSLDRDQGTLIKEIPELHCDLSSLAKGYAVDRVLEALADLGVTDAMVEVGGEVRTLGHNASGQAWRIAIEQPNFAPGGIQRVVALTDRAMATSGGYRNFIEVAGERLPHLLDPRTGWPVRHRLASVSVVAARCLEADGLATALAVLGPEEGLVLANQQGWAAYFLVRGDQGVLIERASRSFAELYMSR